MNWSTSSPFALKQGQSQNCFCLNFLNCYKLKYSESYFLTVNLWSWFCLLTGCCSFVWQDCAVECSCNSEIYFHCPLRDYGNDPVVRHFYCYDRLMFENPIFKFLHYF